MTAPVVDYKIHCLKMMSVPESRAIVGRHDGINGRDTGVELLFEVFSQRYERGSTLVTTNLPFNEWTEVFGSERLTGALLDRLTHHVNILKMNGESYRLNQSRRRQTPTAN